MRTALTTILLATLVGATACPNDDGGKAAPRVRIDAERYRVALAADDYALGGETPLVTVVIYTDYACPPCGRTWQVMDNLVEDYGEDLRVVFRSYTVPGFGKGEQAVEAAFAAGAQDKFWPMHRELFEHQGAFDRPTLRQHAQTVGLDVPKFMDDLDTGAYSSMRMRHRREAKKLGIIGLPVAFVNGLYLAGYAEESAWHALIDEEIARAKELVAAGTPRAELYATMMKSASAKRVAAPKNADKLQADLAEKKKLVDPPADLQSPNGNKRYRVEPGLAEPAGPDDAIVRVVELVDFQCPYCKRAHEELAQLREKYPKKVQFVVRHLPLEVHAAARGAAKASLAANEQGKFWEYHDAVFAHEGRLDRPGLVELAGKVGLDVERFKTDLDSTKIAKGVEDDLRLALKLGTLATPAFFVNGRFLDGFLPGQLGGVIEEELAAAEKLDVPDADKRATLMADALGPEGYPNP